MRNPLANRAVLLTIVLLIVWWLCSIFIPARIMIEAPNIVLLVVCLIVLWRWGPAGWRVYLQGAKRPEDSVIVFATLLSLSLLYQRIWGILFRAWDYPEWMLLSPWGSLPVFGIIVALILAIIATRFDGEKPPGAALALVGALSILSALASAFGHFVLVKLGFLGLVISKAI